MHDAVGPVIEVIGDMLVSGPPETRRGWKVLFCAIGVLALVGAAAFWLG